MLCMKKIYRKFLLITSLALVITIVFSGPVAYAMSPVMLSAGGWVTLEQPSGFSQSLPFSVQEKGGQFRAWDVTQKKLWDPADHAPSISKTYYVSMTGDDGAAGTIDAPLRKIKTAAAKADVDRIIILDQGPYDQDTGLTGYAITRSMSIVGAPGGTHIGGHYSGLAWALVGGKTNTYTATQTNASSWAFDSANLDGNGDWTRLSVQTSIDAVEANAGSIYISGSNIYVHTFDNRVPDADIRISNSGSDNIRTVTAGVTLYLENLVITGAKYPVIARTATTPIRVYMKDCVVGYGTYGDNIEILGADLFALRVTSKLAYGDGFNYGAYSGRSATGVEVSSIGRHNGTPTAISNNGSTGHDSSVITRINGEYYGNQGRNVAEITATKSWNIGSYSHDSGTSDLTYNENWAVGDANTNMWLHGCRSDGSETDIHSYSDAVVYIRKWKGGYTYIGTPVAY